jgi:hypothetical protein
LKSKARLLVIFCIFIFTTDIDCRVEAAGLLYISSRGTETYQDVQLKKSCDFYGMEFRKLEINSPEDQKKIGNYLNEVHTAILAIDASSLHRLSRNEIISQVAAQRKESRMPTLLIMGINSDTSIDSLSEWSNGMINSASKIERGIKEGAIEYTELPHVNKCLSNQKIAVSIDKLNYLNINRNRSPQIVAGFKIDKYNYLLPIIIKARIGNNDIFFMTDFQVMTGDLAAQDRKYRKELTLITLFIPIKYACDTYCWHSPGTFANLSIDDPYLVEPYGHFSYADLLQEMRKSRFHTTIGFIPWNYNRSQNEAVEIVKYNQDKYSLSIHGNDHGLKEFHKTGVEENNEIIAIALARMETFSRMTGIPYDKVMIFPRSIGSSDTIRLLNKYNFLGSANGENIPSDVNSNTRETHFETESLYYVGDFPIIDRHAPRALSDFEIALAMFLGLPVLFEAHHYDFQTGINWFNRTAELTNKICPDVKWVSLGRVFQNLYTKKKIDDRNWDVKMFSSNITIENTDSKTINYHIKKAHDLSIPIRRITVEGRDYTFEKPSKELMIIVTVPPRESREVLIEYENNMMLDGVDLSKIDIESRIICWLVDFRDIYLYRTSTGRLLIGIINSSGEKKIYFVYLAASIVFASIIACIYIIIRRRLS